MPRETAAWRDMTPHSEVDHRFVDQDGWIEFPGPSPWWINDEANERRDFSPMCFC